MDERTKLPRILLAGTASGTGKTTVTCAILQALVHRGLAVASFKCGPDYIDPMFHSKVIGTKSRNLDIFLCGESAVPFLLAKSGGACGFSVIEGVMGLYDGMSFDSDYASTNHVARLTRTPSVLVVNVKGMGRSLAALLQGYLSFAPNEVQGVIFNHCSAAMYPSYQALAQGLGLHAFGYMPSIPEASVESRHLGLITADELADIHKKMDRLAAAAEESIDLDGLLALGEEAPVLCYRNLWAGVQKQGSVRIGVARDRAFCFFYQDNLELLERFGAELCYFSPLQDTELPTGLDGLLLCGGYPEEYAETLSANRSMREAVRGAVQAGMPVFAECGGFMYLLETMQNRAGVSYNMAGALPGGSHMTSKLTRFGYQTVTAQQNTLLCRAGVSIPVHEFHYSDSDNNGTDFQAQKKNRAWACVHGNGNLVAGYPHFHFGGRPELAGNFVSACLQYQKKNNHMR